MAARGRRPGSLLARIVLTAAAYRHRLPLAVYTATLVTLFATSALYHWGNWSTAGRRLWRRADHCTTFVFVAGSNTAYSALALPPSSAALTVSIVWTVALLGVGRQLVLPTGPRWLSALSYAALGAVPALVLPGLLHLGGVLRLGPAVHLRRPVLGGSPCLRRALANPSPATFGFHKAFHACTVLAAVCHHTGLWSALRPRPDGTGRRTSLRHTSLCCFSANAPGAEVPAVP